MNNLDKQYQALLQEVLDNGIQKTDRTGVGTLSLFGKQIKHKMSDGFPLLTTKKLHWKSIVIELLWFLRGDTNIKYLLSNDVHIWDGDAFKRYNNKLKDLTKEEFINKIKIDDEFAKKWGDLGPIYGKQWRKWEYGEERSVANGLTYANGEYKFDISKPHIDQIDQIINELKQNPDSRRLIVSAWNVGELDQMVLPPCHNFWQLYSYERDGKRYLSLMWNQRSVDLFLGAPFNIASYGLLLKMIADEVNMIPDEIIGNFGDVHIYLNHIDAAKEQINRTSYPLPTVHVRDGIYCSSLEDTILENYQSHPTIKAPLNN